MILQNHSAGKPSRTEIVSICAVPAADASFRADRDQIPLAIRIRIANVVLISHRQETASRPNERSETTSSQTARSSAGWVRSFQTAPRTLNFLQFSCGICSCVQCSNAFKDINTLRWTLKMKIRRMPAQVSERDVLRELCAPRPLEILSCRTSQPVFGESNAHA